LTLDFETNKRLCDEIAIIASKRLRNKVSQQAAILGKPRPRWKITGLVTILDGGI
jgi:small subunit ribosomal protein S17e